MTSSPSSQERDEPVGCMILQVLLMIAFLLIIGKGCGGTVDRIISPQVAGD